MVCLYLHTFLSVLFFSLSFFQYHSVFFVSRRFERHRQSVETPNAAVIYCCWIDVLCSHFLQWSIAVGLMCYAVTFCIDLLLLDWCVIQSLSAVIYCCWIDVLYSHFLQWSIAVGLMCYKVTFCIDLLLLDWCVIQSLSAVIYCCWIDVLYSHFLAPHI